jgi:D-glycero-D-manno-heptose 1,7-bisphosphate phosphatase
VELDRLTAAGTPGKAPPLSLLRRFLSKILSRTRTGEVPAFSIGVKAAIFIERDGVLNRARIVHGHQSPPLVAAEFIPLLEAVQPLEALRDAGFLLFVTTNQPGLSRGYLCRSELNLMHSHLFRTFPVDEVLVCPHDEMDRCPCRKPQPGLLTEAAFRRHLDLDRSFIVSDKWQDAEAARQLGCTSVLLQSPWNGPGHHDFIVGSIAAAAQKILALQPQSMFWR